MKWEYFELNVWWWCSTHAYLTHWGRVTHICVGELIIIGSDNGFSLALANGFALGRRQAIIWTNAGIWSMGPLGTNFGEILIEIHTFSFTNLNALENVVCEMASILSRPQCVNELMLSSWYNIKIQILILPYVNKYVIWAFMGWTLRWSDYGWWSVLKTNMYILMAWCRALAAPLCYQWSCCDLALSRRSVDISTRTFIHIRICLLFICICVCEGILKLLCM